MCIYFDYLVVVLTSAVKVFAILFLIVIRKFYILYCSLLWYCVKGQNYQYTQTFVKRLFCTSNLLLVHGEYAVPGHGVIPISFV